MCCDVDHHSTDWICLAIFDKVSRILGGSWAWILPMTPALSTLVLDVIMVIMFSRQADETLSLTPLLATKLKQNIRLLHLQRFIVYLTVILVRVVSANSKCCIPSPLSYQLN
jgi:hypothetical protein